ncbi:MAG: excinuclease ABC subunit UvrC [Gammaproteobacteria bacterium]|nr:excinuclease ABC subunit UvrC [Gammaproteobacteria bacterium]
MADIELFDHQAFLKTVSTMPGVYRMIDRNNKVIYVGKAKNLKNRLASYFRKTGLSTKSLSLVRNINQIEVTSTRTESEALLLENDLIKNLNPRYNILFRDDKSYPYICLTHHKFPRLKVFRGKTDSRKGTFFGPFPSAGSIRYAINHVQRIFQLRNCEDSTMQNRSRACLQYQIKRCTGPCVGHTDEASYARQVEQARLFLQGDSDLLINQQVELMEQCSEQLDFEGAARIRDKIEVLRRATEKQYVTGFNTDIDILACDLQQDACCIQLFMIRNGTSLGNKPFINRVKLDAKPAGLIEAFIMQHYSRHPIPGEIIVSHELPNQELLSSTLSQLANSKIRILNKVREKRRHALENAISNAKQALKSHLLSASHLSKRYQSLIAELQLEQMPDRIECFDISHTMGELTRASCVVFGPEGAIKSEYRSYNIKDIQAGDDYAAMKQVLERRYRKRQHNPELLPDLVLIDGGKGQLRMALDVFESLNLFSVKQNLRVLGVAKGPARKSGYEEIIDENYSILPISMDSPALLLIQQIRDEAHRFAITGHRKARAKRRNSSRLEEIPGIGAKRRQLLLNKFGGLQGVKAAGIEELMQIKGINSETAQVIYDTFHG